MRKSECAGTRRGRRSEAAAGAPPGAAAGAPPGAAAGAPPGAGGGGGPHSLNPRAGTPPPPAADTATRNHLPPHVLTVGVDLVVDVGEHDVLAVAAADPVGAAADRVDAVVARAALDRVVV